MVHSVDKNTVIVQSLTRSRPQLEKQTFQKTDDEQGVDHNQTPTQKTKKKKDYIQLDISLKCFDKLTSSIAGDP